VKLGSIINGKATPVGQATVIAKKTRKDKEFGRVSGKFGCFI